MPLEGLDIEDGDTQELCRILRPGKLAEFDKGHDIATMCGRV